jgi:hypothetical protein
MSDNVIWLCFVAENQAKNFELKTKLTNTNQTSNYAKYLNRAKPMLAVVFYPNRYVDSFKPTSQP